MKPHYTLIKNARVVRHKARRIEDLDILILHGRGEEASTVAAMEKVIDRKMLPECTLSVVKADGNLVMPSFVDLAVCLREPGSMYKEDLAATCKAAMAGGYRALLSYFEPDSRFSAQEALLYLAAVQKPSSVVIYPTAPAKENEWDALFSAGAWTVTDFASPLASEGALRDALQRAAKKDMTFMLFPEIASLSEGGCVNSGIASMMRQKGIASSAEEIAVMRALLLAEETACRLHISGVSTKRSLMFIRKAKEAGLPITCDVSPYHFFLDETAVLYHGNTAKLTPPLRSDSDRMAVIEAIVDRTVDAIASHHTPNDRRDVERLLAEAPFGAVSLETVFSACVEGLLLPGYIDVFRLTELLATAPHAILTGCHGGKAMDLPELSVGAPADFNLVSLDRSMKVSEDTLRGHAKNTPFLGMTLKGRVEKSFYSRS